MNYSKLFNQRIANFPFLIFLVILHIGFFIVQYKQQVMLKDSTEYIAAATNLYDSNTLYAGNLNENIDKDLYTKRPPAYPLLILIFFNILHFPSLLLILQNIISIYILYQISRLIPYNYSKLALYILVLCTPAQLIYANLVMTEIWLQLCIFLIFKQIINWQFSLENILIISIAITFGMLFKPVFYMLGFVWVVFLFYHIQKIRYVFLLGLLPLVTYYATIYINYNRVGVAAYSSISHINLLNYNTYLLLQKQHGENNATAIIDRIDETCNYGNNYQRKVNCINTNCQLIVKKNLFDYALLHTKGMVAFFIDPGRFDICSFFNIKSEQEGLTYSLAHKGILPTLKKLLNNSPLLVFILLIITLINLFKFICFVKFIITKNNNLYFKYGTIILIMYLCTLTGIIGASRFIMPLFPVILYVVLSTKLVTKRAL